MRQRSIISSAIEWRASSVATGPSLPIRKAAAASPKLRSSGERGGAKRQSAAMTRTLAALPAVTASTPERSAVVPARSESPKSAVITSRGRSSALAISAAACFSR